MLVLGMMSGTSADGIDVALCEIIGRPPQLAVRMLASKTFEYDRVTRQRILSACDLNQSRVDELTVLHFDLAERHAQAVRDLLASTPYTMRDIDLIGVHGQTVWHNVKTDGRVNATLQITEACVLAERTGITTISNFRTRDVAAGGQGAPLTAYVDWLLLRHAEKWRAVQNIGGMGNVTLLPPLRDNTHNPVAFDTGPGNVLIDGAVESITNGQSSFDVDGAMAARGSVDEDWLAELLTHPFFSRKPPKTTGREVFGKSHADQLVRQGLERGLQADHIVATITMLTAVSIAEAYRNFLQPMPEEIIIGGGGGKNRTLIGMLQGLLPPAKFLSHEDIGLDSDFKEALVFAVLAHETCQARHGTRAELTGASHPTVLGQITPGDNFRDLMRSVVG